MGATAHQTVERHGRAQGGPRAGGLGKRYANRYPLGAFFSVVGFATRVSASGVSREGPSSGHAPGKTRLNAPLSKLLPTGDRVSGFRPRAPRCRSSTRRVLSVSGAPRQRSRCLGSPASAPVSEIYPTCALRVRGPPRQRPRCPGSPRERPRCRGSSDGCPPCRGSPVERPRCQDSSQRAPLVPGFP